MADETIVGLVLLLILSLLDPVLWLTLVLARVEERDRTNRDLRIWQSTEL